MATTLIIPGLHNSGPDHWQSWFEAHVPGSVRVVQRDWRDANLPDWASRVRREINRIPGKLFIAAHSFGVLAAVQAAQDHSDRIGGALLVAPADPERFNVADYLPQQPLAFNSVVVGSTNDPWMRHDRAAHWADTWGSDFVSLGAAGHINADSGFGPWPEGLALLLRLRRQHAANLDRVTPLTSIRAQPTVLRPAARTTRIAAAI
jgi:predicted alpha/beta hydrolase family esterase